MSNIFNEDDDGSEFRDIPEEVAGQDAPMPQLRQSRPSAAPIQKQAPVIEQYEEPEAEQIEEDEEEDFTNVLSDARLRLEQGRLYELIMNNPIFDGAEADEKAVKFVQKQIRTFAKEQMEIMLGMRQEAPKVQPFSASDFPFNDVEVKALKDLAFMATKGESADPEAQVFSGPPAPVKKASLSTITLKAPNRPQVKTAQKPSEPKPLAKKAAAPVKRDPKAERNEEQINRILREEGISREEYERQYPSNYKPLPKPLNNMNEAEIAEWRRQDALRTNKQVKNPQSAPMPTIEQETMIYTQRASEMAANPHMQTLISKLISK